MRGYASLGILTAGLIFAATLADAASSRGIPLKVRADDSPDAPIVEEIQLYENSHALVIGIDEYTHGWPRLSMAVKDAKLVAAALKKKGFDVTLVLNAKAEELNRSFEEFFILKGEDPEARLFVWYAGHGHSERGEGFLVPADAPTPAKRSRFRLKSLALRRVGEFVRLAESKHAFAIFDSCFSGTVFESARALPPSAVTRATTLPVRQFLTSGDAGQTVSDNGTFRELFLRALNGEEKSDANGDGYVKTPRYGKLRDKDWDRGDFVFTLPVKEKPKAKETQLATATRASGTSTAAAKLQQESLFWESIKDSGDADAYKAYLESFPSGTFAPLAKVKLSATKSKTANRQRAFEEERKKLEAERHRFAAETEVRRKAEDEARRKAFAEERAKLAADRQRFAAEAEARRKNDETARQKAFAAEQQRLAAERANLAQQQAALAASKKQQMQLAALTPPTAEASDISTTLRGIPHFDGRSIWAGTRWDLRGDAGSFAAIEFSDDGKEYVLDVEPSGSGFIKCDGKVDAIGRLSPSECITTFKFDRFASGTVFRINYKNNGMAGDDVFPNPALEKSVLASLRSDNTGAKFLTGAQLKKLLSGNAVEFEGGTSWINMEYLSDGSVEGRNDKGGFDIGKWWIEGNQFCREMEQWANTRRLCYHVALSGNKASVYTDPKSDKPNRVWKLKNVPADLKR